MHCKLLGHQQHAKLCRHSIPPESRKARRLHRGRETLSQNRNMRLQKNKKAVIVNGDETGFAADCLEIRVITQGQALDEVTNNLKEAVSFSLTEKFPKNSDWMKNRISCQEFPQMLAPERR